MQSSQPCSAIWPAPREFTRPRSAAWRATWTSWRHARKVARWKETDSPEAVDSGDAHYLMTRSDALQMALAAEERALAYFRHVYDTVSDPHIKEQVKKFVEEESEHVELCHRLLSKYPPAAANAAADDLDPPNSQE